jgi:D-tyrosyl-tRNA(Tyr) deacylase
MVLLGVTVTDTSADARYLADKIMSLRIFNDADGNMNLAFTDLPDPQMLVVSQFTLYGDTRKGRRPSFIAAAPGSIAEPLYKEFVSMVNETGIKVETGEFGADMLVDIANDGPVTLIIESITKATQSA